MVKFISGLIAFVIIAGVTWAIVCGFVWLLSLCFRFEFDLLVSTGIWLIITAVYFAYKIFAN
ncbi:MAG: hypothetical protein K2N36_08235 [Ruminiclostridium sp.]|nr:hypothetical protein [Ruminiclostridium sp.]